MGWGRGGDAYKFGLVMGKHIEIFAIYRRRRYYRAFPGPTATRGCSCYCYRLYKTTRDDHCPLNHVYYFDVFLCCGSCCVCLFHFRAKTWRAGRLTVSSPFIASCVDVKKSFVSLIGCERSSFLRATTCYSAYMIMLLPVCLPVCHTGGSVENGWNLVSCNFHNTVAPSL